MRDLVVDEGLRAMAADAAECLRELIAGGEEIPYEVIEPGNGSPLCRYEPRTEAFVRDHSAQLSELDSFGSACATLEASELAGRYLDEMGIPVPEEPRRRAELAGIVFLCRLWMGSSDFSLEPDRLDAAIDELQAGADVGLGEIEVIVPLRGFQMPVAKLELATATIVRGDTVEVPAEAQAGEGLGGSPWEPAFLAVARIPDPEVDPEGASDAAVVDAFRTVVTTLRLYKPGGVGLGPHAWTKVSGDRWRRIATGAGRSRPGGYRLADSELADLQTFSRALAEGPFARRAGRPGLPRALARSLSRFEAGLERNVVIEALNDYLLALRFVLEGGGPAELSLPMRISALCAEPERRAEVKAVVDRAIGLERELWSGEPAPGGSTATPAETAAALEELTRAILKDAACGHLGLDLRSTADEILLADGLAVGEGSPDQRGETAEWRLGEEPELIDELTELDAAMQGSPSDRRSIEPEDEPDEEPELDAELEREREPEPMQPEPIPPEPQMRLAPAPETGPEPTEVEADPELGRQSPVLRLIEQTRAERRAHHEKVAGLFPPPETTEWNIREIAYDRRRRAEVPSGS